MRIILLLALSLIGSELYAQSPQWIRRADYGNFGRHRALAVSIGNKVYCGTGHLNGAPGGGDNWYKDWWQFDPNSNTWTQKADYPGGVVSYWPQGGDQDLTGITIGNCAYIGMGQLGDDEHFKYDPATNSWTLLNPAPAINFNNTFPFVIGDYGYFPQLSSTNLWRYDPSNDSWTLMGPLPATVGYGNVTFAIEDKGYFKKGASLWEYKPTTDSWISRAPYPGSTPYRPVAINQDGYGIIIGGYLSFYDPGNEVWRFDPLTNSWDQLDDFPGSGRRWAVATNVNGRVFYGLGTNGTNFEDWWEFGMSLDVNEFKAESFAAYPNIATDYINFEYQDNPEFEISIFDQMGRLIRTEKTTTGKIKMHRDQELSGLYFYHLSINGESVHSDRFIFQ